MSWKNYKKTYHRNRLISKYPLTKWGWNDVIDFVDEDKKDRYTVSYPTYTRVPKFNWMGELHEYELVATGTRIYTRIDRYSTLNNLTKEEYWSAAEKSEKENRKLRCYYINNGNYSYRHPIENNPRHSVKALCKKLATMEEDEWDGYPIPYKDTWRGWY